MRIMAGNRRGVRRDLYLLLIFVSWLSMMPHPTSAQDIDECSSKENECVKGKANCTNTEGSYKCTCQFGNFWDGTECQVDECQIHEVLEDVDRNVSHTAYTNKCDNKLIHGWYRFLNVSGLRMPTSCPDKFRCGTSYPGWLSGAHPTVDEGIVTRDVCFHLNQGCCVRILNGVKVKNCGSFYVYSLLPAPVCPYRYCYTSN